MILQKQPNNWSCLPTAFAMILELPVEHLITLIGHDGSEIKYPQLKEPFCRRSFSPHEFFHILLELGYACTPILKEYELGADEEVQCRTSEFMDNMLRTYSGVICGVTSRGNRHSVAWDRRMIFDPTGIKYFKEDFGVEVFFIVTPLGSRR